MSISVALSSTAVAISAQANQEANEAKCIAIMKDFQNNTSTIQEKQSYAECVNIVYPNNLSPASIIALKVLFVIALFTFVSSSIFFYKNDEDVFDILMLSIGAVLAVVGSILVIA